MNNLENFKRTDSELKESIKQQYELLEDYCRFYDSQDYKYASEIATKLRILFKSSQRDKSLYELILSRFNIKNQLFSDFGDYYNVRTRNHESKFLHTYLTNSYYDYNIDSNDTLAYIPILNKANCTYLPFATWWNVAPVIAWNGIELSRKDVVCLVAEKDGGAHVDESYGEKYFLIKRNLIDTLTIETDGELGRKTFRHDTSLLLQTTIRTIAEETLIMLRNGVMPRIK